MSWKLAAVKRSRKWLACVAAAGAVWASSSLRADVMKVVPADALGVLKVRNIGEVSTKWGDFAAKLGIAAFSPELADPLGGLKSELGVEQGLREDGELGVVLLPASAWPGDDAEDSEPAVVVLIPVTDYAAFLGNFPNAETADGVTKVTRDDEELFVTQWGEYAAVSPEREYVLMKGNGVTLSAQAAKELASKDTVLWANVPALRAAIGDGLKEAQEEALKAVDEQLENDPGSAKYGDVIRAAVTQVFLAGESFLRDARSATLSINLTDAGINTSLAAEFDGGSYLGGWVNGLNGGGASFTRGLAAGSYIVFGGLSGNGAALAALTRDLAGPVVEALKKVEGTGADAAKLVDATERLFRTGEFVSFGMLAPRGQLGAESLLQFAAVVEGDAQGYISAFKDYNTSYAKLMSAFEGTQVNPFVIEYKPGNRTVDGVTFDSLVMGYAANPRTPEEAMMQQMMRMFYGPTGLSYEVGALDDRKALFTFGMNDNAMSRYIASARGGQDPVGQLAHVRRTTQQLPAGSFAVLYVALDEVIRTGTHYAQQFGIPVNLQLPPNLSPIGVAVAADGPVLKVDSHLPTDLLQSLIAAVIQMQMGGGM
ncbi:MAG: hypothetical protein ACK4PI_13235 [Tepidisphaerales bacterium]